MRQAAYFPRTTLLAAFAFSIAIAIAFIAHSLWQERAVIDDQARDQTQTMAALIERALFTSFHETDLILQITADEYRRLSAQGPIPAATLSTYMGAARQRVSHLENLRIFNAEGRVTHSDVPLDPARPVSVADRAYFQRLRTEKGLIFAPPLLGRISNQWIIPIQRRIECADGSFCGGVGTSLPTASISKQLATLDIGPHGAAVLFDAERNILVRHPEPKGPGSAIGLKIGSAEFQALWRAGQTSATYTARSTTDGQLRVYSYRQVGSYPLFILVGIAPDDYLQPWWNHLRAALVFLAALVLVTLLLSVALRRAWRDQERERARYHYLLAAASDGIHVLDRSGQLIEASQAFCDMLGYTREEVLSLRMSQINVGLEERPLQEFLDGLLAQPMTQIFETRHRRKDGTDLDVEVSVHPLNIEGTLLLYASSRDITDRKRVEQSLRDSESKLQESQERYRLLLEHSPVGILHYDRDLVVSYANRRFAEIMKVPHGYMVGLDCKTLRDKSVVPGLQVAVSGSFGHYEGPYRTSYAGVELFIAMNCAPLRNATGEIIGGIAIIHDITDRTIKARELAAYRDHLEDMIAERTADLEAARAEAERLARVKSEFLANMSHEIRTPLNGVLGMAQIGYRDSAGRGKAQETFAKIIASGKLLLGIINDILDFSRMEAGKLKVEAIPVCPAEIIDHSIEIISERAAAKGLEIHLRKAGNLPANCLGDPLRIGQILLNLLSNAVKFTEHGTVTLAAERDGDQLVFRVSDTGIGMDAAAVARIFAPFEQADSSTTRRFGGSGLGLTITHRIVELMGGHIRVDSSPGSGSSFEVRLPYVAAPEGTALRPGNERPADVLPRLRLAGLRILVAEDNEINQFVLEENLREDGADVVVVSDGAQAVKAVLEQGEPRFDLVLMDVQMPEMDGYEATRAIHTFAPALPIVGQTAHAFAEEKERCRAAGMVDHLSKPIDPEEMVATILKYAAAP